VALGEAFINVRADLKPFTKDLARDLKVILAAAEKQVAKSGQDLGKRLSDGVSKGVKANAPNIANTINKEVLKHKVEIKTEVDKDNAVASTRRAMDAVENVAKGAATSISKRLSDTFASTGRFLSGSLQNVFAGLGVGSAGKGGAPAAAIAASAIGVVVSLIATLIPLAIQATQAVGGLAASLALIPTAGAAVAGIMTVLNLAFLGFDKALTAAVSGDLDAFNKALEDLTPSARRAARALFGPLSKLQDLVQSALFDQLVGPFRQLGKFLSSPAIKNGLDLIARSLGDIIGEMIRFAVSSEGLLTIQSVFDSIYLILAAIRPVIRPLASAIATIIRAGSPALVTLANVIATLAQHFADFIADAEKSGALQTFFDNLGKVFTNTGPIIEKIVGLLFSFLNWAVSNPDAITNIANAFSILGTALATAFSDPEVVAGFNAMVATLSVIPPETWVAIAKALTLLAIAFGILGSVLLVTLSVFAIAEDRMKKFFAFLLGSTDKAQKDLKNKAALFKQAGTALMNSFLDGMKNFAGRIGDVAGAIVSAIKGKINSAISGINSGLANAFSVFGVNPPDIPFLAKGGVITGPTLAVVGEKGPEAVVPLNDPGAAAAVLMKSGLANMLSPVVQVFLGTEELEQRMYRVVGKTNSAQATSLRHGPRTV